MFTNRFIELPTVVYNVMEGEIIDEENAEKFLVKCMINPYEISAYRQEPEDKEATVIMLRSGQELVIALHIAEFEKVLDSIKP